MVGSLAIDSITEEFVRQQSDIAELQAYLQLPQHKPLKAQLDEAGELMDGAEIFYLYDVVLFCLDFGRCLSFTNLIPLFFSLQC